MSDYNFLKTTCPQWQKEYLVRNELRHDRDEAFLRRMIFLSKEAVQAKEIDYKLSDKASAEANFLKTELDALIMERNAWKLETKAFELEGKDWIVKNTLCLGFLFDSLDSWFFYKDWNEDIAYLS